ncbi:Odorant receptor [Gryllus bimaculatus]|nr:Odorant receptor [Gryllus bimaculatus]
MAEAEEEAPLAFPARLLDLLGVAVSGGAEGEGEGEGEGRGAGGRGVRLRFAFVCAMLAVETFAWIHHTMHAQRRYLLAVMSFTALPWLGPLDPRTGRPPAPLPLSLPVDDTRALGYYFNVASQVSQMLLFTLLIPTTDCTLAALMAHVALRLRGVAVALDQLRPRDGAAKGRDSGDGQWARRLRQCVSDHQVALGYSVAGVGMTSLPWLVPVGTESELPPLPLPIHFPLDYSRPAGYAFTLAFQGAPVAFRRDLLLVLLRAQRPTRLTAMRVADLSLFTFGEVMKLSYSYYNLLNESNN